MREVRLRAVRVDLESNTPVLLLQEMDGLERTLPIYIGPPEATAIAMAQQGISTPRPMTHDLVRDLLDVLQVQLVRVVITELREDVFFADIHLLLAGRAVEVSARPSDAIAVAVRTGSPIFVDEELMESRGRMLPPEVLDPISYDEENPEELVGEFREFLDTVRPEDFSS